MTLSVFAQQSYQGEPLTKWLQDLGSQDADVREKAKDAVRAIGTNALPAYLETLRSSDSTWDTARAADAIAALGTTARPALPALVEILKHPRDRDAKAFDITFNVALAFRGLGVDAVAPLTNAIGSNNAQVRALACGALAQLGPVAKPAVPCLVAQLQDDDSRARNSAIIALGEIHGEPELVVPALVEKLRSQDDYCKTFAAMALGNFRASAKSAVPALVAIAKDGGFSSPAAISALEKIDPTALAAAKSSTNTTSTMPR